MTLRIVLPSRTYGTPESVEQFHRRLRDDVRQIEGVRAAGLITALPLVPAGSDTGYWIEDFEVTVPFIHDTRIVLPGYFEALQIPVVAGRRLGDRDALNATNAVVVSESFARQHWGTTEIVGKRVRTAQGGVDTQEPWSTIVGVMGDVRSAGLSEEPQTTIYLPALNVTGWGTNGMTLVVSSSLPDGVLVDRVRTVLATMDTNLPVSQIRSMEEILRESTAREAFTTFLLAVAATLAIILGAVGIYGVISFIFAQRRAEVGLRIALGARHLDVISMVLTKSMLITSIGIAAGLIASLVTARVLRSFLFGVSSNDLTVLVSVPILLAAVALLASLVPAIRAGRQDPATVMRSD